MSPLPFSISWSLPHHKAISINCLKNDKGDRGELRSWGKISIHRVTLFNYFKCDSITCSYILAYIFLAKALIFWNPYT